MSDTPTPRTDEFESALQWDHDQASPAGAVLRLARRLERELAAKDAHADEIYKAAVDLAAKLEADLSDARQSDYEKACILDHLADRLDMPTGATDDEVEFAAIQAINDLAAERALADRLAGRLEGLAWLDSIGESNESEKALAAWKEGRK